MHAELSLMDNIEKHLSARDERETSFTTRVACTHPWRLRWGNHGWERLTFVILHEGKLRATLVYAFVKFNFTLYSTASKVTSECDG
jgi:hypothetical protein